MSVNILEDDLKAKEDDLYLSREDDKLTYILQRLFSLDMKTKVVQKDRHEKNQHR